MSEFRQQIFGRVANTAFYVSRGTFWGKIFVFEKKNYEYITIFGLWAKKFRIFGEKFPRELSKLHSISSHKYIEVFEKIFQNAIEVGPHRLTWTHLANIG